MNNYSVEPIPYKEVKPWIMLKHYAKRMPSISFSFGLYKKRELIGVVTYGTPASPFLCKGICGFSWVGNVLELNRLCLLNNKKNEASYLVGNTLKLIQGPRIIVSYADTKMNHIGYVYQATNWHYTGATKERTDMFSSSGHSRHNDGDPSIRVNRSAKHRYVFFIGTKKEKQQMLKDLKYQILSYPKGETKKYKNNAELMTQRVLF